ncbi:MAG: hypothetical protein ACOCWB_08050 [Bacteroidota bacterium]
MTKQITYIAILVFLVNIVKGQDLTQKSSHEINLGAVFRQSKDYCLNKTRYHGIGLQAGYAWKKNSQESMHDIAFDIKYSKLTNRYDVLPASFYVSPELSYGYARNLTQVNTGFDSYMGGQLNIQPNLWYYAMWDDSHFYWFTNNNLSLYNHTQIPFNNNFLELTLSIPIVALVSRPVSRRDYKMEKSDVDYIADKMYSDLKLQSINRFQGAKLKIGYTYRINSKVAHRIAYSFNISRVDSTDSKKLLTIDHGLQMVLILDKNEE